MLNNLLLNSLKAETFWDKISLNNCTWWHHKSLMDMGNHRYGTYDSLYIKSKQINKTDLLPILQTLLSGSKLKRKGLKELSFCHKLWFSNNDKKNDSLKYLRLKSSGCKDIAIVKLEFVAKTQFLWIKKCSVITLFCLERFFYSQIPFIDSRASRY